MDFNKNKKIFWVIIVSTLIIGFFWSKKLFAPAPFRQTLQINQVLIEAEVAQSLIEQYRGLSGRQSLETNAGMLFNYQDNQVREFVMRNMNFPLDIIFIRDGQIIKIAANLEPEGSRPQKIYQSGEPVNQVLEVGGGFCEKNQIKVGDQVLLN
jgi:hypothetical protein